VERNPKNLEEITAVSNLIGIKYIIKIKFVQRGFPGVRDLLMT